MIKKPFNIPSASLAPPLAPPLALFILLLTVLLPETPIHAQTQTHYIQPSSEVVVRRGQGREYKIVAMVKDGTSVELLEESEDYAKVRLANDKEGWMLKRFLSNEPPLKDVVATLRNEKEELKQKEMEIVQQLEEMSSSLDQARQELHSTLNEKDQIRATYQALQEDTADIVQIQKKQVETARQNKLLTQELASVKQKNKRLQENTSTKWFLTGGGVLLLGILIGAMTGRSRKRKSSLY